jgi:hypothetical protein
MPPIQSPSVIVGEIAPQGSAGIKPERLNCLTVRYLVDPLPEALHVPPYLGMHLDPYADTD